MIKRIARILLVLLLLGACSNIATAWLCAVYSDAHLGFGLLRSLSSDQLAEMGVNGDRAYSTLISRHAFGLYRTERYRRGALGEPIEVPVTVSAGWPRLALTGAASISRSGGWLYLDNPRGTLFVHDSSGLIIWHADHRLHAGRLALLPVRPMWPGFVVNTLLHALCAGVLGMLLWFVPVTVRRRHRARHHRCAACGYPRGPSEVCSECGSPLSKRPGA